MREAEERERQADRARIRAVGMGARNAALPTMLLWLHSKWRLRIAPLSSEHLTSPAESGVRTAVKTVLVAHAPEPNRSATGDSDS